MSQTGDYPSGPAYTPGDTLMGTKAGTDPLMSGAVGANLVTKSYELAAWGSLRPELIFDQFATVRATRQSHRGASVQFTFIGDLAPEVTPLIENLDVDSQVLASTTKEIALKEYGNAVTNTALLRATSMIPFDPIAAERVGYNAGESLDILARTALDASTITTTSGPMSSAVLREGVLKLKQANVRPFAGGLYVAVISPKQEMALRAEADAAGWRWVVGTNPGGGNSIYMGEVGVYEGVRIVVNNHLTNQDTGYMMGAEGLAKVFSSAPGFGPMPRVIISPVVDKLRRFASVGWHFLGGYGIFRSEAVIKIVTT